MRVGNNIELGAVTHWLSGGTPSRSIERYWVGDIPWISAYTLKKIEISESDQCVTAEAVSAGSKMAPINSTLLLVRGSALHNEIRAGIVCKPICFNQDVKALIPSKDIYPKYLTYSILGRENELLKLVSSAGNTAGVLDTKLVQSFQIWVPDLEEQRAIATALSDVDALLEALDRLIGKKRDIKQAAMQGLLTPPGAAAMENGKLRMENEASSSNSPFSIINSPFSKLHSQLNIRLPGFGGEWETKQLGHVGHFLKGSSVKRDDAQSGSLACVRYGEIYTVHNDYIQTFHSWISQDVAATATRLQVGDLLFAGSGETKEEIGKCVALITDTEAYAGGDIVILRPNDVDSLFLGYVLNAPYVSRQKASFGQGDAVVHISAAALAQVSVTLPSVDEQTAIATVLSNMDAEIEALQQRRAKTAALKQGMMQELLTGRIRLVEPHREKVARV